MSLANILKKHEFPPVKLVSNPTREGSSNNSATTHSNSSATIAQVDTSLRRLVEETVHVPAG